MMYVGCARLVKVCVKHRWGCNNNTRERREKGNQTSHGRAYYTNLGYNVRVNILLSRVATRTRYGSAVAFKSPPHLCHSVTNVAIHLPLVYSHSLNMLTNFPLSNSVCAS